LAAFHVLLPAGAAARPEITRIRAENVAILIFDRTLSGSALNRLRCFAESTGRLRAFHREAGICELAEPEVPDPDFLARMRLWPGVLRVLSEGDPFPRGTSARASFEIEIPGGGGLRFGAGAFVWIAGPCAVEDAGVLERTARACASAGASMLRGGAFKPRTSPYAFQGLGRSGLDLLAAAAKAHGLALVTEVLDPRDVELVASKSSMLQIGSRSMQNFPLLREVGASGKPVLLKRGGAATLEEFLGAAEYLLEAGADRVALCERGVRSFEPSLRNLLDLAAVPALKARSSLPVVVDPSHGTGNRSFVPPMAKAAVAAGADAVMTEVHPDPSTARSDGSQALRCEDLPPLSRVLRRLAEFEGREWQEPFRDGGREGAPAERPFSAAALPESWILPEAERP